MAIIKTSVLTLLFAIASFSVQGQIKDISKRSTDSGLSKIDTLKAAIVTATTRPHIKGDTIDYNTQRVQLPPNAVVADLLRRMPGLHVDQEGAITYNGEKIQRLLVNGEDIFGSNPALVIQNFDAAKIARVQILDRKSDRATFSGIDDGARIKTLNLELTESAKNSYFGKLGAGANTQGIYNLTGELAGFRGKEQLTAMTFLSNTGTVGLSGSGSSISLPDVSTDPLGASAGTGIPKFQALAAHYANTWNQLQDHLNANYQFSHYNSSPFSAVATIQTQHDIVYRQNQYNHSENTQQQHGGNMVYSWEYDKYSALNFAFNMSATTGSNRFRSEGNSSINDTLVNSNRRSIDDNLTNTATSSMVSWRTSIGKNVGRVLSVNAGLTSVKNYTQGYVYSLDQFYRSDGSIATRDTVDQRKLIKTNSIGFSGSIGFTQPLWKNATLATSYGYSTQKDHPLQITYEKGDGKYEIVFDSLSSQLGTTTRNQFWTLGLQGQLGNIQYTLANDYIQYSYQQREAIKDSLVRVANTSLSPRLFLSYTPNNKSRINFTYFTSSQPPSADQLIPVANNADPLHIVLGNPALKPSFVEDFKLTWQYFGAWITNAGVIATIADNGVSTQTTTDSLGRQILQPVNVNGGKLLTFNFSVSRKLGGMDWEWDAASTQLWASSFSNDLLAKNKTSTATGGITVSKYVQGKYNVYLRTNFTFFDQKTSINTSASVRYLTQSHQGSVSVYFLGKFELNTNANYTWQQKSLGFASGASVLIWNTYIRRTFLHERLECKWQFNNLLGENAGIVRNNSNNVNTQLTSNILGRYWMLSATYHFDRKLKTR